MRMAFLDVGHGNCFVIHNGRTAAVVDVPPGRVLVDYLRRENVTAVSDVVISHFDKDHCGGFVALLRSGIKIGRVWYCDDQENRTLHYRAICGAVRQARREGARVRRDFAHSDVGFDFEDLTVEFLSPHHEDRMLAGERNRMSVMARIARSGHGLALLPADLDLHGYEMLEDGGRPYGAEWLVAPHHGGTAGPGDAAELLTRTLLDRSGAKNLFFSFRRVVESGDGPPTGRVRPRREILEMVRAEYPGVNIYCAQLSGHCEMVHPWAARSSTFHDPAGEGIRATPLAACAGSVVLDIDSDTMWRFRLAHAELVSDVATSGRPMCSQIVREPTAGDRDGHRGS